jgi:hypothetical protein
MANGIIKNECVSDITPWSVPDAERSVEIKISQEQPIL